MTSINATGTLTQQLYRQLFDRLNTDGDDALSVGEIAAAGGSSRDELASVFKTLDADSDGRVMRAEMTPSGSFGADALASLIDLQAADGKAETDEEILADLFARADVDGDGALSEAEMKAEGDLRRAASLDAGYMAGPVLMSRDKDGDGLLTQDEIGVARAIKTLGTPLTAIRFHDELPEADRAAMDKVRERMGLPPAATLTDEEKAAERTQWAADAAERASGPEGTLTFLSRQIEGLRTQAAEGFETTGLSDTLTARLLQQILGEAWKTGDLA